jgi:hypothetical protein
MSRDWQANPNNATNYTDGIINISNNDSSNMGPSSMNAEVKELIQEKLNEQEHTMMAEARQEYTEQTEADRVLAMQARA